MDAVSALGFGLKREVPKGAKFEPWVRSSKGLVEFVDALYAGRAPDRPFTWKWAAETIADLTHWKWEPTPAEVRVTYQEADGKLWDAIEIERLRRIQDSIKLGAFR
jgi:hypothetical protein